MPAELIDISEARARVLAVTAPGLTETVDVARAHGRVMAEDVAAESSSPPFDASAMDGFAVIAGPGRELPVVGESRAGLPAPQSLSSGQAIRISTGAAVPAGADSVIPVERVEQRGDTVVVPGWEPGRNIRRAGEDMRAGAVVLRAGTTVGPAELAVLVAAGRERLRCAARPRVAVLATGDELVEPGEPLGPGQIRNSNAYALAALVERAGAEVALRRRVPDEAGATRTELAAAIEAADVVCVSGGVSVGPHDHVKPALAELGVEERFWGVRLKPGKPTWFGTAPGGQLVFGLPGNPVSAMVTFHLFARPALRRLTGADPADARARAVLDVPVTLSPRREQVLRCRLAAHDDGWHVQPTREQGSHILTSMLGAGAFALVPSGEGELAAGERVEIELL